MEQKVIERKKKYVRYEEGVKAKLLKLNMSHVEYVMGCLLKNTT